MSRWWHCSRLHADGEVEKGLTSTLVCEEDGSTMVDVMVWQDREGELLSVCS